MTNIELLHLLVVTPGFVLALGWLIDASGNLLYVHVQKYNGISRLLGWTWLTWAFTITLIQFMWLMAGIRNVLYTLAPPEALQLEAEGGIRAILGSMMLTVPVIVTMKNWLQIRAIDREEQTRGVHRHREGADV